MQNRLKCQRLRYETIRQKADAFRAQYWPQGTLPVDPELIAFTKLNIDIVPLPDLHNDCDIDAVLQPDCRKIFVDAEQYRRDNAQNRMRFSLAHELGHVALHESVMSQFARLTVKEWIDLIQDVPEEDYKWFEWQACEFAGRLLVPLDELRSELEATVADTKHSNRKQNKEFIVQDFILRASRKFQVSRAVIEARYRPENLSDFLSDLIS